MPAFTKRPVTIEAMRFETNNDDGTHLSLLTDWANGDGPVVATHDGTAIYLATLEGTMRGDVGDWIIRGVKGELYPCKPDIFDATYAPGAGASPLSLFANLEGLLRAAPASRALSVALTHLETARLWAREANL